MTNDELYIVASEINNLPEENRLREILKRLEQVADVSQKKMMKCYCCGNNGLKAEKLVQNNGIYVCDKCLIAQAELVSERKEPYDPEVTR